MTTIVVGPIQHERKLDRFPGVDGLIELRMGQRGRIIRQTTTLLRQGVNALNELIAAIGAIQAYEDQGALTLIDDFGRTFGNCSMQTAAFGPILRSGAAGMTYLCQVEIVYLQLAT